MSSLYVYIEQSLDLSGRLIDIGLIAGCKLFTSFLGRKKHPADPATSIASLFVIFMSDVEYAISIVLVF